jgi:hypothetical protein
MTDKHFYWCTTTEGERIKCAPHQDSGALLALDGSKRRFSRVQLALVEPIEDSAPGGLRNPETHGERLMAAALSLESPQKMWRP